MENKIVSSYQSLPKFNKFVLIIFGVGSVVLSFFLYSSYSEYEKVKNSPKAMKLMNSKIETKIPDFYKINENDAIFTSYILKTGLFSFNRDFSYDGIYNKNWLPLAFNYCQLLKEDTYSRDSDLDNDGIPDFSDNYPYDYSNGDYLIRESTVLDFDNDGVVNNFDEDSDGNNVLDVFQGICMSNLKDSSVKKQLHTFINKDSFILNEDELKGSIYDEILETIKKFDIKGVETDVLNKYVDLIYTKLTYSDNVVITLDGKDILIKKEDILSVLD